MKTHQLRIARITVCAVAAIVAANCINQGAAITLTGRAVNPRKQVSSTDYAMSEKLVSRIEAIPQSATGNDGVQTGFFTSTSKVDASGNFKVVVSPGSRTLLVATLNSNERWQAMIDAKDVDTALGDVTFVDPTTTVLNLCWSADGDHDTRLLNTSSGLHWGYSGTGSSTEAKLDFDDTNASGCENITLLQNSGAKYVFAVARYNSTVNFQTISTPTAKLITGNGITTVTAGAGSTGCGATDRWWAAFAYQNGAITLLNKCSSVATSNTDIPAAIQN